MKIDNILAQQTWRQKWAIVIILRSSVTFWLTVKIFYMCCPWPEKEPYCFWSQNVEVQGQTFRLKLGIGSALISHTSAATFHPTFTSLIGWRTNMHKAWCVLSKGEWNYVWTDIVSTFGNVQHKFQEDTRFVYTKLRLHPQQIIRVITIQLFAEFSHIIQIWNKFKVISS